jgi:hypothetical protein
MVQYAPPCEGRSNRRGGYLICNRAPSALLQYCSTTIPNLPSLHLLTPLAVFLTGSLTAQACRCTSPACPLQ